MKYEIIGPAEDEAKKYYDCRRKGLGIEFIKEISRTISRITEFPEAWAPISSRARRCLVKRFPYGIIYQIRDDKILILAFMHLSRKPDYWKGRAM